jgi:hypothetical protein
LLYPLFNGRWVMTDLVYIHHFSVRIILRHTWGGNGYFRYLMVSSYFHLLKSGTLDYINLQLVIHRILKLSPRHL